MKILFINVSIRPDAEIKQFPVGLGYVVTSAHKAGFEFDLLDIDIHGYTDQYVEDFLSKNKYDVIAFGTIVTHYQWVKWLIKTIKSVQPRCKVMVGNSVGESIPEILFANSEVDIIVLGEGEITTVEVLKALEEGRSLGEAIEPAITVPHTNGPYPSAIRGSGIEGIVFRDEKGRVVNNGLRKAVLHIDELPMPDWDLFDIELYLKEGTHIQGKTTLYPREEAVVMPVSTARGCVFKCSFCHYTQWNDHYRHRSPESVIAEIKRNQSKYGANYINFWDDLSFHKIGPAEKFVDALLEADLGIHWTASIRSDLFGRQDVPYEDRMRVASKFKEAGASVLCYSLESGNDDILKAMNKRVTAQYFRDQIALLSEIGDIVSSTSLVFGYPTETPETIAESMEMCLSMKVYPSPGFLLPLPATEMWKYALENGHITDPDQFLSNLTERQDIVINMTQMSDEALFGEVSNWLQKLNNQLQIGLDEDSLIRTGGIEKHSTNQAGELKSHSNLTPDLNYATVQGSV